MLRRDLFCSIFVTIIMVASTMAAADNVLSHIPKDAYGFLVIHNMESTSAKIEKILDQFNVPLSLLQLFIEKTGLGEGINQKGDLLVALLPGKLEGNEPGPAILLPVTDYADLAKVTGADPAGGISSITLRGEDLLLARWGVYALLMDTNYRTEMESMIASETIVPEAILPFQEWMDRTDVVAVLLPKGTKLLVASGKKELAKQREQMEEMFEDLDMDKQMNSIKQMFLFYDQMIHLLDQEMHALAIGASLDDQGNLRIGKRVRLEPGGKVAKLAPVNQQAKDPLLGMPDGSFLIAAGGPLPKEWKDMMITWSLEIVQSNKELLRMVYGVDEVSDEKIAKIREIMKTSMSTLQSMAFCFQPGVDDAPIMDGFIEIMQVNDAKTFLVDYQKTMEAWADVLKKGDGEKINRYHLTEEEIAGKPGLKLEMDFAGMVQEDQFREMITILLGGNNNMVAYLGIVDEHHIAMCYDKTILENLIAAIQQSKDQLIDNAMVRKTKALLPNEAPWSGYVSPKGCVDFARRIMEIIMGRFGGAPVIPEYPTTPPIGFSWQLSDRGVEADMVIPAETIDGLSDYVRAVSE
ncbi:MAG: hypothetical protein JW829_13870 [Pirellulales bacterium]|nr:hypothetical protein [Pirellulales bacterium]